VALSTSRHHWSRATFERATGKDLGERLERGGKRIADSTVTDNPTPRTSLNENAAKKPSKGRRFG
jgi:hypothetical protein